MGHLAFLDVLNEPVEKVNVLRIASSAGSKIESDFLSVKDFGSGNRGYSQLLKGLGGF
jgi:hypothetical protein